MSDYTPTTGMVRVAYVDWMRREIGGDSREEFLAEFGRWLEGVQREARAEGALWAMNNGYAGSQITDINHHQTNTGGA